MATRPGAGATPAPPWRQRQRPAAANHGIFPAGHRDGGRGAGRGAHGGHRCRSRGGEEAREASGDNEPPKRAPRRRKLGLGLLAALPKPPVPKPPPVGSASKPQGDWWHPALIWPILREVAMRGCSATAVAGLVNRFPPVYGALARTNPLSVITVSIV
jgi:hypothetical protein